MHIKNCFWKYIYLFKESSSNHMDGMKLSILHLTFYFVNFTLPSVISKTSIFQEFTCNCMLNLSI